MKTLHFSNTNIRQYYFNVFHPAFDKKET